MNLTQIGRDLRKIIECLKQPQPEPEEAKLAREYAELCAFANQRLLQCASMLDAGDSHQALQLAEVSPPLLDLVTLLAFEKVDEWRTRCRNNQLPIAELLDSRSIKSLNAAYGKGIAANAPLYKEYREAMMKNDDARAMAILRTIVRLNPSDSNAARELKNLEANDLAARLGRLNASIQAADQKAVLEQIQEIESCAIASVAENAIWRQAQGVRCKILLRELQDFRRDENWPECLALLDQIRQICAEFSLDMGAEAGREIAEIDEWARQQARAQAVGESFLRALDEFGAMLDSGRLASLPGLTIEELNRETTQLDNKRRELDQFAQKIPPEVENRFTQIMQALRINIHKRQARKTTLVRIAAASGVAILIVAGLICFEWGRESNLAKSLQNLMDTRQVAAIEKLSQSMGHRRPLSPRLTATLQAVEAYLNQTHNDTGQCLQKVAQLNGYSMNNFAGADVEQVYHRYVDLVKVIKALPADAQSDPRLNLTPFESRWNAFLSEESRRRSTKFTQLLDEAETRANSAAASSQSNASSENEQRIITLQSTLDSLVNTAIPALQMDGGAADKFHGFREEWETWRSINQALASPESQAGYLNALRRMPSCHYFSTKTAAAAATIASLDLSPLHLKAIILMPGGQLQKWTNYLSATRSLLYPADVQPAEKTLYLDLRDDEQIHQVWLYAMDKDMFETLKEGSNRTVYSIGPIVTKPNQQVGRIYDPTASPYELKFKNVTCYIDKTHFKEEGARSLEYLAYEQIGLNNLIDSQTGAYQTPLLEILDRINQETNSSPLFRAFVAMKLYSIIDVRPADWGCIWCPAAVADHARLLDLGADRLRSGNWYVPSLIRNDSGRLEKYFALSRNVSYMKQARFYQALAKRLGAVDFSFVGYVNPERGLITTATGNSLWGFSSNGKLVALYKSNPQTGKYSATHPALPFTPVFCFAQDYNLDVEQACQAAGIEKTAPSIAACPLIADQ